MQVTLKNNENHLIVKTRLDDERRSLANFFSILDKDAVDEIEIADCPDAKIPRNIQRFEHLQSLTFLRCHALTEFPAELGRLPELRSLGFIRCADFYSLERIEQCRNLEVLHVSGCECFNEIPDEIGQIETLRALDLSYSDNIRWIELSKLPQSLRLLDMHGCWQGDFDPEQARRLRLVSLQIQDLAKIADWDSEPAIDDICNQLRHTLALRNGYALDS